MSIVSLNNRWFRVAESLGLVTQDKGFAEIALSRLMSFAEYLPLQVEHVTNGGGATLKFSLSEATARALGKTAISWSHSIPTNARKSINRDMVKQIGNRIVGALNVFQEGGWEFKLDKSK